MENEDRGTLIEMGETPLIDAVTAALISKSATQEQLALLPFADVLAILCKAATDFPELVAAGKEVRKYYGLCHTDCHFKRVKKFVEQGSQWYPGQGPEDPDYISTLTKGTLH